MTIEAIIHIKITCHDEEMEDTNTDDLTEFIIDTLNNEFRKDFLEFEKVDYKNGRIHIRKD